MEVFVNERKVKVNTEIGRWSLLGGLIGYERLGPRRRYRFLWIPLGRIPPEVREKYEGR